MRCAIGIDIGGTSLRVARVSERGEILAHPAATTPRNPRDIIAELDRLIALADDGPGIALGIGIPARVAVMRGTAMPGGSVDLSGPPLRERLQGAQHRTVVSDNEA